MRLLLVGALLAAGCTGKTAIEDDPPSSAKDPPPAQKAEPAAAPDPAAANREPAPDDQFGPECQEFFEAVSRRCGADGPPACEQAKHRVKELRVLAPGSDGTMGKYDWLCKAELPKLPAP